mmetsp:Transcript_49214/g.73181  ORF Transcript_49214/g.73181 Transcript_49214/m.73181 type:complete len:221 (-) Transcript_49214:58-720(-)
MPSLVGADRDELGPVGGERNGGDHVLVLALDAGWFERRAREKVGLLVFASDDDAVRALVLERDTASGSAHSGHFAQLRTRIPRERDGLLVAVTTGHDTLALTIPVHVSDTSSHSGHLLLEQVLLVGVSPNADLARLVSGSDIVAVRGEFGNGDFGAVLRVHRGNFRGIAQRPRNDGGFVGIDDGVAVLVDVNLGGATTLRDRERRSSESQVEAHFCWQLC